MSVQFEELTLAPLPHDDRRRSRRFRFSFLMPATVGRGDALILDISADGARVIHYASLPLDSQARLVFLYGAKRFSATARVLASRVSGLGNGPGGATSYESRLMFVDPSAELAETLAHIVEHIESDRMRGWVSNAAGEAASYDGRDQPAAAQYFTRCRLRGRRWSKTWTRDPSQPSDGFTVPAKLADGEIRSLCEAYETLDDGGRDLIRATAGHAM